MKMAQLRDLSLATFLAADFFVLEGPDGDRLTCQWTAPRRTAGTNEFEIITPESPDTMGCLFGLYDAQTGEFRMRMAVDRDTFRSRDDIPVDLDWRGDLNCVLDVGNDWEWDKASGRMVIVHPLAA
jgi:hypothetical protein